MIQRLFVVVLIGINIRNVTGDFCTSFSNVESDYISDNIINREMMRSIKHVFELTFS